MYIFIPPSPLLGGMRAVVMSISQARNRLGKVNRRGKVKGLSGGHADSEWWSPDSKLVLT